MANQTDNKSTYKVLEDGNVGEVQIANEVVAIIAGLAAIEVQGVYSMAGNITNELVGKLGVKNLAKGVKVAMEAEEVKVDMAINMKYGFNIPKTCNMVQDKVKQAIENMTGLKVAQVNVRIVSVCLEEQ